MDDDAAAPLREWLSRLSAAGGRITPLGDAEDDDRSLTARALAKHLSAAIDKGPMSGLHPGPDTPPGKDLGMASAALAELLDDVQNHLRVDGSALQDVGWDVIEKLVPRVAVAQARLDGDSASADSAPALMSSRRLLWAILEAAASKETYLLLIELLQILVIALTHWNSNLRGGHERTLLAEMMQTVLLRWDTGRGNFMSAGMSIVFDCLLPRSKQIPRVGEADTAEGQEMLVDDWPRKDAADLARRVGMALRFVAPFVEQADVNRRMFLALASESPTVVAPCFVELPPPAPAYVGAFEGAAAPSQQADEVKRALADVPRVPGDAIARKRHAEDCRSFLLRLLSVSLLLPREVCEEAGPTLMAFMGWLGVDALDLEDYYHAIAEEQRVRIREREEEGDTNAVEGWSDDEAEVEGSGDVGWAGRGVGALPYFAHVIGAGARMFPMVLAAGSHLRFSLESLQRILALGDLRASFKAVETILHLSERARGANISTLQKLPAMDETTRHLAPLTGDEVPVEMRVLQRLVEFAVRCPRRDVRAMASKCLLAFRRVFEPTARFWLTRHAVESCPYSNVVGTLLDEVRNDMSQALRVAAAAEAADGDAVISPFLRPEALRLLWFAVDKEGPVSENVDIKASAVTMAQFLLMSTTPPKADPWGIRDEPHLTRIRKKLLEPLERDAALRGAEYRAVLASTAGEAAVPAAAGSSATSAADEDAAAAPEPKLVKLSPGELPPEMAAKAAAAGAAGLSREGALEGMRKLLPIEFGVRALRDLLGLPDVAPPGVDATTEPE